MCRGPFWSKMMRLVVRKKICIAIKQASLPSCPKTVWDIDQNDCHKERKDILGPDVDFKSAKLGCLKKIAVLRSAAVLRS